MIRLQFAAIAILCAAFLTVLACAACQAFGGLPKGVKAVKNVEYTVADGKPLLLDLYVPENSQEPRPLVVWVHGGGWMAGDKSACPAIFLVPKGYVVASLDYRLAQEAKFPAQIQDCKTAIRFLKANAAKYGVDPQRVGVWGASAGGHLAALLGVSAGDERIEGPKIEGAASSEVQAVCDWYGPTDFIRMHELKESKNPEDKKIAEESYKAVGADDGPVGALLGGPIKSKLEQAALASPACHLRGPGAKTAKELPPFLIMQGAKDPIVPLEQSVIFADALKAAGARVELKVYPEAKHDGLGGWNDTVKTVSEFFDANLKGPKS